MAQLQALSGAPLRLTSTSIDAVIVGETAEVTLEHAFVNDTPNPLEVLYTFPLDDAAVVRGLVAEVAGKSIEGVIKSPKAASDKYSDAVAQGNHALLLEQVRDDVLSLYLGNMPPASSARVTLRMSAELGHQGDLCRFVVPLTIGSRYAGSAGKGQKMEALTITHGDDYSAQLSITVRLSSPLVTDVQSPSHPVRVAAECDASVVSLVAGERPDADFVLLFRPLTPNVTGLSAVLETDEARGTTALCIYGKPSMSDTAAEVPTEFVFIVDRSGSMAGQRINNAAKALQLFMRSLPVHCRFNVVSFGSTWKSLWRASAPYSDESLREATQHVATISADMGGTELYPCLASLLASPSDLAQRRVILITDGEVSEPAPLEKLVAKHCSAAATRVFTIGIGESVSRSLVEGLAKAGRGSAELVGSPSEISDSVIRQLRRARGLDSVLAIDWGGLGASVRSAGSGAALVSDRVRVYAQLPSLLRLEAGAAVPVAISLKIGSAQHALTTTVASVSQGHQVHALTARARVRDMATRAEPAHAITDVAVAAGILSRFSSMVAEVRGDAAVGGTMQRAAVPLLPPRPARPAAAGLASLGGGTFSNAYCCTIGVDFRMAHCTAGNEEIKIQLWDTAGQERFCSLSPAMYRGLDGAWLIYDITSRASFDALDRWAAEVRTNSPGAALVLAGAKADLAASRVVQAHEGRDLAARLGALWAGEFSSKDGANVASVYACLIAEVSLRQQRAAHAPASATAASATAAASSASAAPPQGWLAWLGSFWTAPAAPVAAPQPAHSAKRSIKVLALGDSGVGKTCFNRRAEGAHVNLDAVAAAGVNPFTSTDAPALPLQRSGRPPRAAPVSCEPLVLLQSASGRWELTEELARAVRVPMDSLVAAQARVQRVQRADFATALALAFLAAHGSGAPYDLVVRKGRDALGARADELVQLAAPVL